MRRAKFDTINVVPFIDIMLVLLVIVLTTATFIQTGLIKVELPASNSVCIKEEKKELKISIQKDGKVYFDDVIIAKNDIEKKLLSHGSKTPILLSCDKNAKFDNFVFLLDIVKKNGYENLGIVTKHE